MSSFLGVPVDAAYHLVSGLTGFLTPVPGGLAAVAAIVAFTMAVRLLLMPLSLRALRGQAAQARLAPHLVALRQRYGKQPERLQREMAALYKREGTSMFAGFAPLLLQWPFLSVMYLLFRSPTVGGTANTLLTHDLPSESRRVAVNDVLDCLARGYDAAGRSRPRWVAELRREPGNDG